MIDGEEELTEGILSLRQSLTHSLIKCWQHPVADKLWCLSNKVAADLTDEGEVIRDERVNKLSFLFVVILSDLDQLAHDLGLDDLSSDANIFSVSLDSLKEDGKHLLYDLGPILRILNP